MCIRLYKPLERKMKYFIETITFQCALFFLSLESVDMSGLWLFSVDRNIFQSKLHFWYILVIRGRALWPKNRKTYLKSYFLLHFSCFTFHDEHFSREPDKNKATRTTKEKLLFWRILQFLCELKIVFFRNEAAKKMCARNENALLKI